MFDSGSTAVPRTAEQIIWSMLERCGLLDTQISGVVGKLLTVVFEPEKPEELNFIRFLGIIFDDY